MNIVFRVDSSTQMGLGHLSRCLTLANALKQHGHTNYFVCRAHLGSRTDLVKSQDHQLLTLSATTDDHACLEDYLSWLGVNQQQDAIETLTALQKSALGKQHSSIDWLIVDHYALDQQWHKIIRPQVSQIMVVDDLANRPLDCDLVLDQTPGRSEQDYKPLVQHHTKLFCGSQFALLRPEFLWQRRQSDCRNFTPPLLVLISLGGTDPRNITTSIVKVLNQVPDDLIARIDIVLTQAPCEALTHALTKSRHKTNIIINSNQIATYYASADIVIGASGVSALERCAVGTPSLQFIYADNQRDIATYLATNGAAITISSFFKPNFDTLSTLVQQLASSPFLLEKMSAAANKVCDGNGTDRIAAIIMKNSKREKEKRQTISLLPATKKDRETVFRWQSDTKVRRFFRNSSKPSYTEHQAWFKQTLSSDTRNLYLLWLQETPCGLLRLDLNSSKQWEISILIAPNWQGKGIAKQALAWVKQQTQYHPLIAEVHPENKASQALFAVSGFIRHDSKWFHYP